jgi:hypothetical protein
MSLTAGKGAAGLQNLLLTLSSANVEWHEVAKAIALAEQQAPEEVGTIRSSAAAASGYSAGLIARYLATYDRIRRISDDGGPAMGDMLAPAFNTVEAAVKLFELDRQKGLDAFRRLKDGKLTLAAVRSELTDAKVRASERDPTRPSSFSSGVKLLSKDVRRRRQSAVVSAIQRGFAQLSGQYEELAWRGKDSFLQGEGVYRIRRASTFDSQMEQNFGLETVVMAPEKGPRFVDTILPATIVRARFFLQYYLAFWLHPMDQIERATLILDALEEDTIGIVSVGQDGRVELRRKAVSHAKPDAVDRMQAMLAIILRDGSLKTIR